MCNELGVNRKTVTMILKGEKLTNNYDFLFEYADESVETNENITSKKDASEEVSSVHAA